jgi:O-antigen/teichoic acid export membrane protein
MSANSGISHKKIAINAISAVAQVVIAGLMYFFLYRYLIEKLGASQLGVWALVLSTSSIASLANFGITSGLVKFVADYKAKGDYEDMNKLIFTAFISIFVFFTVLILIAYVVVYLIINQIVDKPYIPLALKILPYSLLCLFINEVGGVFTSILEGFQKNYIRNLIYIAASILFLFISFALVPRYGLAGVAYAQVIQSVIITVLAVFTGSYLIKGFSVFRWNWGKAIFKSLISYGSKFQLVSLLQMLYEPATKALLTRFGGLPAVGFYEMATRLVNQVRALIVNANQVMVPVVAEAAWLGRHEVQKLYIKSMSVTLFINIPLISAILCFSPFISYYWIGHYESHFTFPLGVLAISMFFNIMCGPAFFSSLGEGKLNLLVWVNVLMGVLNISLGLGLGYLLKGNGVILSWGITYAVCSLILIFFYQKSLAVKFKNIFSRSDGLLFFVSIAYTLLAMTIVARMQNNSIKMLLLNVFVFGLIFIPVLYTNKNFKLLFQKLVKK